MTILLKWKKEKKDNQIKWKCLKCGHKDDPRKFIEEGCPKCKNW